MDIKAAAKAWLAGILVAGLTYSIGWIKVKLGVEVPIEVVQSLGTSLAEVAVSIVAGAIGYWAVWRVPNAPQ